jgi:hypothetical protein
VSFKHPYTFPDPQQLQTKNVPGKHSHLYIVKDRGEISELEDEIAHWFRSYQFLRVPVAACSIKKLFFYPALIF